MVLTHEILKDGRIDDVTIIDFAFFCVNPLAPKGDQHLISPYITPESNMKVMRIEEMITN